MRPRSRLPFLPAIALLAGVLSASCPARASSYVGDVMADFTLLDVNGAPVSLYDFGGHIVVVNFFATWCPGCNAEAQSLEHDIWQAYASDGVVVLSIDLQEQLAVVLPWIASQGVTYRILMAPNWDVFARFPYAGGLPYNAVIDGNRVLRYGSVLYDRETILGVLDGLLGRTPVGVEPSSWGSVQALFR